MTEFLRQARDAQGRPFKVIEMPGPGTLQSRGERFCDCYLNFYLANGAVILPQFGDMRADTQAREMVAEAYPKCQVVPIELEAIASGGGLIHCVTQQEPAA
jgi:agmatine deiminase